MSERDAGPATDAPPSRAKADEPRQRRARLRVYLGYAPGVGKTFTMLEHAREMLASGVEIVVGVVETHGRYDTASLVLGLPILPRRRVEHRGRTVEELDLDAAVERRPHAILVDDLAHENAPGARHVRRYQDVLELLDAGIDVHTTLNVAQIESLNDIAHRITTLRERLTVPDAVLERADEIELVDLTPEELILRLKEGKIHVPEHAAGSIDHLFGRGTLLALRELALRCAAEHVDQDMLAYREEHGIETPSPAVERILVCVGPSPASERLVRATRRMAARLQATWTAVYVEPTRAPHDAAARERIDAHLRLADSLGAEVVRLTGARIGDAILDHARRHHVTRIVLGKPTHARILDRLRSSVLDDIVRASGDIDVLVISGDTERAEGEPRTRGGTSAPSGARGYLLAAALAGTVTAIAHFGRAWLELPDAAILYLLAVTLAATRLGRGPSIAATLLSVAAYDFFFIPPRFSLAVASARSLITFAILFSAGLLLTLLTFRIRKQERRARERELRTSALYTLSRELGAANDPLALAAVLARHTSDLLSCGAAVLLPDDAGRLTVASTTPGMPDETELADDEATQWVLEHGRPAGLGTGTFPRTAISCFPLGSAPAVLGVLAICPTAGRPPGSEERQTMLAFARQTAIALSRARLAEEAKTSALRATSEELRSSLLANVSHDLRTPIAAITGAAAALRDASPHLSDEQRTDLLGSITHEAERIERLVGNLLEMTRIEAGGHEIKRELLPLRALISAALARLAAKIGGRSVRVDLPPDLPLISVDPLLMEQVFVNLLDNAERHTPRDAEVEIRAHEGDG
ncbi:MAG: DUF4118 domain-containing protein, partial [Polyangiaceae bacterium]